MPSLKDLRSRISSVKATQKITKAMQMVAAAKLRRAQEAAESARPFAERMEKVLTNLNMRVTSRENASPLLVGTGKDDVHLLVVATAERGLCGGFNTNIARFAREHALKLMAEEKSVKILCVGKKGYDVLKNQFKDLISEVVDLKHIKKLNYDVAQGVAKKILTSFEKQEFDVCTLFFSEFQSIISQVPTPLQLIPANFSDAKEVDSDPKGQATTVGGAEASYEFEPGEEEILTDLLPRNIATQIFRALLENAASEQGARMSAMDNATRNAGDMIGDLTLKYNRTRQAMITKELIEIVSGAEAV
ncbi:MAG: F0F1 ATP synthase subunit gamma [Pseudomonadota bacterium]